jgi:hypothetical protein
MGFKFVLTNEIRKASLIIGLKKHLKQNFKLINLAKQKNIPIYGLNQVSFYQVSKLFNFFVPEFYRNLSFKNIFHVNKLFIHKRRI